MDKELFNVISESIIELDVCNGSRTLLFAIPTLLLFLFALFVIFIYDNILKNDIAIFIAVSLPFTIVFLFCFIFGKEDGKFLFLRDTLPNKTVSFSVYEVELNNEEKGFYEIEKHLNDNYFIIKKYNDTRYLITYKDNEYYARDYFDTSSRKKLL